jgi:hypothetical protein
MFDHLLQKVDHWFSVDGDDLKKHKEADFLKVLLISSAYLLTYVKLPGCPQKIEAFR